MIHTIILYVAMFPVSFKLMWDSVYCVGIYKLSDVL